MKKCFFGASGSALFYFENRGKPENSKVLKSSDRTKKKLSDQKNDENFDFSGISIPDRGSFR